MQQTLVLVLLLGAILPLAAQSDSTQTVEQMPLFYDCGLTDAAANQRCSADSLVQFVVRNLRYPTRARENGVEGIAVVQFIVERDGSLSHIEAVRDPGQGLGKEAIRIVEMMPNWTPGTQEGKPVRVRFNLPVKFALESKKRRKRRRGN